MKRHIIIGIFFLVGWQIQSQEQKTLLSTLPEESLVNTYLSAAGNYAIIYTGKEEPKYHTFIINHPYLDTNEYRDGSLSFDGIIYPNTRLRLNVNEEELIIHSPDGRFNLIVPRERLDYAIMDSLYLFYYKPDAQKLLPEGYYVRLHEGKYPVLKRQTAFYNSTTKDMVVEASFNKRTRYYIYKDNHYNSVGSKGSVLKLFKTHKKELKRYIKQHQLNFKQFPDEAIVAVTKYYEFLSQ